MTDKVIDFNGITYGDIPPDTILEAAKGAGLDTVIIIGKNADNDLYIASSTGEYPLINWLLDLAKQDLLLN